MTQTHNFQGQKVKGQLAGGVAYCGGLPHSLLLAYWYERQKL